MIKDTGWADEDLKRFGWIDQILTWSPAHVFY